jgi:hypothetical protein
MTSYVRDLVVLAACKDAQFAVEGILSRRKALCIRPICVEYVRHPEKDPGVARRAQEMLRLYHKTHAHALAVFDREGCGREHQNSRLDLERKIEDALQAAGWGNRAAAIVIDPELEAWIWSDSPHVDAALGWAGRTPDLRTWLRGQGLLATGAVKPARPKEAMLAALREVRVARSSNTYAALAKRVSLNRCSDEAFVKLKETLRRWFGDIATSASPVSPGFLPTPRTRRHK